MKILWIVPKWTLPVSDGARVATDSLIRNTISAGAEIDLLCLAPLNETGDENELVSRWKINQVFKVNRRTPPAGKKKFLYYLSSFIRKPNLPLTFSPYFDPAVVSRTMSLVESNDYDYVLLDGLHLGSMFLDRKIPSHTKLIYRAHNIETDLWKKSYQEKNNLLLKLLLYHQSVQVHRLERAIIDQVHMIAPIAKEDMDEIKKIRPHKMSSLVPLGMNFAGNIAGAKDGNIRFLFIGKLDWAPNKDGLEWLLKEVWPEVIQRRPEAQLKIVGSGNREWLEKYQGLPGVNIVGFVNDVKDAYEDCQFTIVPVFYGSGTRIKVIESFVMNRRLISSSMGVQGASLRDSDYERADTKEEWINILSKIQYKSDTIQKMTDSREYVANIFCERKIGNDFYNWLKTVS